MFKGWKKINLYLLVILIMGVALSPMAVFGKQEKKDKIRIGYIDYAGFIEKKQYGDYQGYGVDYLMAVSKYTDWDYEFVYDTWENCMQKLHNNEIDLLCVSQYTEERAKMFEYSKYPAGLEYSVLYVREDNETIFYNDYDAFQDMTIGVMKGSYQDKAFDQFAERHHITFKKVEYPTDSSLMMALYNHSVDAVVASSLSFKDNVKMVAKFSVDPFYFMATKDNKRLLDQLDEAVASIKSTEPYFEMKLYDKYYGSSVTETQPLFTREEEEYLHSHKNIKVGYFSEWYPFSWQDIESGHATGITIFLLDKVAKVAGVSFQYIPIPNEILLKNGLKYQKYDFIADRIVDDGSYMEWIRTDSCTDTYLTCKYHVISNQQYIHSFSGLRLVLDKSKKPLENYLKNKYQISSISWADSMEECFKSVKRGVADFTLVDEYGMNSAISNIMSKNLYITRAPEIEIKLAMGVGALVDPVVISIINKCLLHIEERDISNAIQNISHMTSEPMSTKQFLIHYWYIFIMIIGALLAFLITIHQKYKKSIQSIQYIDKLTGCHSLQYFKHYAYHILKKQGVEGYYIVKFDIFRFKFINQHYGTKFGDIVLGKIATYFGQRLGNDEIIARISDDNFVMLIHKPNYIDLINNTYFIEEQIKTELRMDMQLVVKLGLYKVEDQEESIASMIDKATIAQKSIKENPKEVFAVYNKELSQRVQDEGQIEIQKENALHMGEFQVYLQPKIDLTTKKLSGAEALVRWIKRDGTMIYPDQFIPVFERNGFIEKLDLFVLDEVCKYIAKRKERGDVCFPVSINQSRYLMSNPYYLDTITEIISRHEIEGKYIEIELTETMYMENKNLFFRVIEKLHERNMKLSIDDFGNGYSSLNLISDISADILKIDRAFLIDSTSSQTKRDVIEVVVTLAHKLNMKVVCEGVETKEQEEFLESIDCDIAQGYLYSKPISIEEFDRFVNQSI